MTSILIIDDEPAMAPLVGMAVDDFGVTVYCVGTFQAAVEFASTNKLAVLLLDLALGEEDGMALLPRLRAVPSLETVPIVAFSVHHSREAEAMSRGMDGFVKKPFTLATLRSTLYRYIQP
ncbi:MAG: response regulator [Actinobacteria bacterium]|jgi:DNA-binding response OmpR family regulator|nr:response regulator [Actinomycetota bacterium]MCL6095822.1 response regulator [Actinomycetota bacterium]